MGMGNSFETITVLQYRLKEAQEELERRRRKEERVMLERHAEATLPAWKRFQSRYSGD